MLLIACLAAIGVGGVMALILRAVSNAASSSDTLSFGYYCSGSFFAIALSITPALFLTVRNYGRGRPFGMTESEMFWAAFPWIALILSLYPALAKALGIHTRNVLVMFLLAIGATLGAVFFLRIRVEVHFDLWMTLIYGAITMALFLVQIALASVHSKFAKNYNA